jgi:ATP:ADP antiporter, AAA family
MTGVAPAPPPWRRALPLAALLALLVGAHGVLETARDALFLADQPVSLLPWLYLAVTAAVLAVTAVQTRLRRRGSGAGTLTATVLAGAGITAVLWYLSRNPTTVNVIYVWAALFSSLVFVQFWLAAVDVFDVSEAKQVFGPVAAGGLVGAVLGQAAARAMLEVSPPRTLLLLSAAVMVSAALLARQILRGADHRPPTPMEVTVMRAVPHYLRDPYFLLIALLALLPALAGTLIDFLFKATVASRVSQEAIPTTIANAYLVQSVLALGVELLLARWLLARAGVTRTLLLLPLALLASATGFLVVGGLAFALALRVLDAGLRPSLNRVGTELLYVPVSPAKRRLLKPSIDTLGQRGGQTVASVLLLLLMEMPRATVVVTGMLAVTAVAWLWVVRLLRPLYLGAFGAQLSEGRTDRTPDQDLSVGSAEVLVGALGAPDSRDVLSAMDLLATSGRLRLIPALILYHPDPEVVLAALTHFEDGRRPDVDALLPRLLSHADPGVRARAVERWPTSGQPPEALRPLAGEADPRVRTAALVVLSGMGDAPAIGAMERIARSGPLEDRRALAQSIADRPRPDLVHLLELLFASGDEETQAQALRSASQLAPPPEFIPTLIGLLPHSRLRHAAREALAAIGAPALTAVGKALLDPNTPYPVDRELAGTLYRFESADAAPYLLQRMAMPRGGVSRFRALRTLNRFRRDVPGLPLDRRSLERALSIELSSGLKNRTLRRQALGVGIPTTGLGGLLCDVLQEKETASLERAFRVLQLLFPGERLDRVYLGARSRSGRLRGAAQEVLVELLTSPWRDQFLVLLRDLQSEPTARSSTTSPERRADFVSALLAQSSAIVRVLAAHLVAESGWVETLPQLRSTLASLSGDNVRLVQGAIDRLERQVARAHG